MLIVKGGQVGEVKENLTYNGLAEEGGGLLG